MGSGRPGWVGWPGLPELRGRSDRHSPRPDPATMPVEAVPRRLHLRPRVVTPNPLRKCLPRIPSRPENRKTREIGPGFRLPCSRTVELRNCWQGLLQRAGAAVFDIINDPDAEILWAALLIGASHEDGDRDDLRGVRCQRANRPLPEVPYKEAIEALLATGHWDRASRVG